MGIVFNRIIGGQGGVGGTATILVDGVLSTDTVVCQDPDGVILPAPIWTGTGYLFSGLVEYGLYTISAIQGTKTKTAQVLVDAATDFSVTIVYSRLPSGYTEVEYIQPLNPTGVGISDTNNAASCYINTSFRPTNKTNIEFKADITYSGRSTSGSQVMLGARYAYTGNMFCVFAPSGNGTNWTAGVSPRDITIGSPSAYPATIKNDGTKWYIDDVLKTTSSSYNTFTSTYAMQIFAFSDRGKVNNRQCDARLYFLKVWNNGTLALDLVPCYNSSNVYGLYDLVNNEFLSSSGSGVFTGGAAV